MKTLKKSSLCGMRLSTSTHIDAQWLWVVLDRAGESILGRVSAGWREVPEC